MLRKTLRIKNVGRFEDAAWRGGAMFELMTLIYAENGRGKSTFCDILRSCQTGVADYILGRKRLGSANDCEVELRTDTANLSFKSSAWNSTLPAFAIFDTTFIHQNVYAGDRVDHEHKKNLYRVIVGEDGVKLATKVDDLDAAIRDAGRDVGAKRAVLDARIPYGTDLAIFTPLPADADIVKKIAVKAEELKAAEIAAQKAAEIKSKSALQEIVAPTIASNFEAILAEKLPGISADAEKKLRAHIAGHTAGATETWLQQGLAYQKDDTCPFCGQDAKISDLVSAYRAFFDSSYNDFKSKLVTFGQKISSDFSDRAALTVQKTLGDNGGLHEFWQQLGVGKGLVLDDITTLPTVMSEVREEATTLLKTKLASPLEAVPLSAEFKQALSSLTKLQGAVATYNGTVRDFNTKVNEYKAQQGATDVTKLKNELATLQLIELRHDPVTSKALGDYQTAEGNKSKLEGEKAAAKTALDKYAATVLSTHEKRINEILDMFAAGFRISGTERSYVGGKPSSNYKLVVNGVAVDLGEVGTPLRTPSFRNTLSSGDRSTLALALFISQLERDPQLKDKIIVFDDPFTSQDRSRRSATQSLICALAKKASQVFVLSHDPHFLRALWDTYKGGGHVKCFQFFRMANGTAVGEWDVEKETASEYAKKHRVLWDYRHSATGSPREVAQTIRPVLEEYLRLKLPHSFADNEWLGDFIAKIRAAAATDPLAAAQCINERVEQINDYSKKYHHSSNPAADTETIDEGELENYVRLTLELVGGF